MSAEYWNIILYAVGMIPILLIYLPFSPMTIDLLMLPRDTQIAIYRYRHWLWAIGTLCFAILVARGVLGLADAAAWGPAAPVISFGQGILGTAGTTWLWIAGISIGMLAFMFWSGYVPYVMTPPKRQRTLDIEEADKLLKPDDVVLGLVLGGEARAYPRDAIARPHFFTDTVAGTPLTISYCILCNSGVVFKSELGGRPMKLQSVTAYNNNIIYHDPETGNFIQQLDGSVFHGPDTGKSLEALPVVISTWEEWKHFHPDTKVYYAPAITLRDKLVAGMLQMMIPIRKLSRRRKPWHRIRGKLDGRLPPMSFVFGVEVHGETSAYPLSVLDETPVINDMVGGEPIVVLYDKEHDIGEVFSRRVNGDVLTFREVESKAGDVIARDEETESRWDVTGVAQDGKLAGKTLNPMPHYNKIFWFSWALFKPGTKVKMAA